MKVDKILKKSYGFIAIGMPISRLIKVVALFLYSSTACNASPGISSLDALTIPVNIAVFLMVLTLFMLNYIVYKKTKRKLVWLLSPAIIMTLYLLLILPSTFYGLIVLAVLMLNYLLYKKTKKKLVWLLSPIIIITLYFLSQINNVHFVLHKTDIFVDVLLCSLFFSPILLALMITYLLYEKTKKKLIWLLFPVISLTICLIGLTLYFLPELLEH